MSVKREFFGELLNNQKVYAYTLTNKNKLSVTIINYGGIVTHLYVPDSKGNLDNVVLGFNELDGYINKTYYQNCPYFGAIIGRYANRIRKGKFSIGKQKYKLAKNDHKNHLHGGKKGFDKVLWKSKAFEHADADELHLQYFSFDGEEGYPGDLRIDVIYRLNDQNELIFTVEAKNESKKATPVNLTNHSYFNLSGLKKSIEHHELLLNAQYFLKHKKGISSGRHIDVNKEKAFNFRDLKKVGANMELLQYSEFGDGGYDHNFVLDKPAGEFRFAARLHDPESERSMLLFTNKPGLQFYTADGLNGEFTGHHGKAYQAHDALCLEPQFFPDSPNNPKFQSSILKGGETYEHLTIYKFLY